MVKTKKREFSYLGMLGISILLFIVGWKLEWIHLNPPAAGTEAEFRDAFRELKGLEWMKEALRLPDSTPESPLAEPIAVTEEPIADVQAANGQNEDPANTQSTVQDNNEIDDSKEVMSVSQNMTNMSVLQEDLESAPAEPFVADSSYFDDALFIGDSRTVGLSEYGNLGQAEVLADSGMSVYKIMKTQFPTRSGERMTLEQLVSAKQFGKVYIMLGINELGYDFDQTVKRYQEMVDLVRRMQPNAIIFLQANLHITGEKSESSPYYNNTNINRFNSAVEGMADGETIFYLDVNELFDDEEGNLAVEYTTDHTHILGKHYGTWGSWILSKAIPVK